MVVIFYSSKFLECLFLLLLLLVQCMGHWMSCGILFLRARFVFCLGNGWCRAGDDSESKMALGENLLLGLFSLLNKVCVTSKYEETS